MKLISSLAALLSAKSLKIVTAESCTGGLIAADCTSIPGSSNWFERGFVTYSNEAKIECLGVPAELIAKHGAVSDSVAAAMAEGAIKHSHADIAIAVTGIAGPDGGSEAKPVGTVWFGLCCRGEAPQTQLQLFAGDRQAIREAAKRFALNWIKKVAESLENK